MPSSASQIHQPNTSFVITDVILFTGDEFIENGYVVVKDGLIALVGEGPFSTSDVHSEADRDVPILSKPGCTLIPGLIDSHVHGLEGNIECLEQSLRFGVTTVCDMHNDPKSIEKLRKHANDPTSKDKYADFKCAGVGVTIEGGWPAAVIELEFKDQPEKAAAIVKSLPRLKNGTDSGSFVNTQISENGASYIKLMHELGDTIDMNLPRPPLDIQKSAVDTAHSHGVICVGHAFSHAGAMDLLKSGVDGLTHIFMDKPPSDSDWLELMKRNNAHCCPTLACCASQMGEGDHIQIPFIEDSLSQKMLFDKRPRQNIGLGANSSRGSFEAALDNVRAVYQAGLPIVAGSDCAGKHLGTIYGLGVHIEMNLLSHRIGMQPIEVLKSATSLIADRFRFRDRGRIRKGQKADFVLLEGDVRKSLSDTKSLCLPIQQVWRDGVQAAVYIDTQ